MNLSRLRAEIMSEAQSPGGRLNQPMYTNKNRWAALLLLAIGFLVAPAAMAQSDATTITTAASGAFGGVATLCVTIGTFFAIYKLVRRIK